MPNKNFTIDISPMSTDELMEHLETCFGQHDWYYEYSDDMNVWSRGDEERLYLRRLAHKIGAVGIAKLNERLSKMK